jgi:hypothetical protein
VHRDVVALDEHGGSVFEKFWLFGSLRCTHSYDKSSK